MRDTDMTTLTLMQMPNDQNLDGNQGGEAGHSHETFSVLRLIYLLPYKEWQPGLDNERRHVHTC